MIDANIQLMSEMVNFDVIIVCTNNAKVADYWQQRLESGVGTFLPTCTVVLAVDEDWKGGAGNALGTLYAFQKAAAMAKEKCGMDLASDLASKKVSVALYHVAGKGTRMAPLPGGENNNKPGVKLPAMIKLNNSQCTPMTILESVIKQTGCYSRSRKGRLSVFWGDQIFIPTVPVEYIPKFHVDILCKLGQMVDANEWTRLGLQNYGLIIKKTSGECCQVEKVDHPTALQMLDSKEDITNVGVSLGSFSLSSEFLVALIDEFAKELKEKTGKLDSDPHLWMPMSLSRDVYINVMVSKKIKSEDAANHFDRIRTMMKLFSENQQETSGMGSFGCVDVGQECSWWDYGQLKFYQTNALIMRSDSDEGRRMRKFFHIAPNSGFLSFLIKKFLPAISYVHFDRIRSLLNIPGINIAVDVDSSSVILGSQISFGNITNSVLNNVHCDDIQANDCVLVNVTAKKIVARPGSIIYNVCSTDEEGIFVDDDGVEVGVFSEDGSHILMKSSMDIDGGKAWDQKVKGNSYSFGEIYELNVSADPTKTENAILKAHDEVRKTLINAQSNSSSYLTYAGLIAAAAAAAFVLMRKR